MRALKVNPEGLGNPLVILLEQSPGRQDAFDVLRDLVLQGEVGERYEVELADVDEDDYDALPEHGGW